MEKRTLSQLKYYHGLVNQLKNADEITIQLDEKEFKVRPRSIKRDDFRYLLKMLDTELRCVNEVTPTNKNKIEFCDATIDDLIQHISWIIEALWHNKIVPFDLKYEV